MIFSKKPDNSFVITHNLLYALGVKVTHTHLKKKLTEQSEAATIGGVISWSEIGFFYFAGSFLALLLGSAQPPVLAIIGILNLLTLPYTFFSVYYQAFVIKKWCTPCLAIQIAVWLAFLIFFFGIGDYKIAVYTEGLPLMILFVCFSFGLPITVWYAIKSILKENIETPDL